MPTKSLQALLILSEGKDETGPSVEAENPDTRIEARRNRIAARVQAKRRQEVGDDIQKKAEIKEEARPSQRQMEESERHMAKLKADGTERVTNILVVADSKELKRREELREANRLRLEKLENEAKSSTEKFSKIMNKWTEAKTKVIHQELRDDLRKQQQLCCQIVEDKNKLIKELQQELKGRDDRFVKDRKRDAEEVDLLIERMQEQISSLKKDYRKELDLIESSFGDEWKGLLTDSKNKWEHQRNERSNKELEFLLQRMKMLEEHESVLHRLRMESAEEYNKLRIKLETDVQRLERDLQERKATYQLNQEKLEYNVQMLKKYEEEYAVSKAQQIRKITRLQDMRNNLKKKCAVQEKQSREEIQSVTNKYNRLMQQYKDLHKRKRHFAAVYGKRYEEVWLMKEDEAKGFVSRAVDLDRVIHEQILGLSWSPPTLPFMDHSIPKQPQRSAQQVVAQVLGEEDETQEKTERETEQEKSRLEESCSLMTWVDRKTVKIVLELLCDEMGFLIESNLHELVSTMEKSEQTALKLDSIFSAMGIKNEEDINKMTKFILRYKLPHTEKENMSVNDQAENECRLIHPNDLLRALRAFTAQYCKAREIPRDKGSALMLERMNDGDANAYWEHIANIIPESKLKVWRALEAGLKKYHTELTKRSKLLTETQQLKQQNSELRMLLQKYQNSKVNAELMIPPIQMRQ
ncbi:dynein regulatory complex protein 1-like isoform X1 [Tachysurus vachellii]|uniref:dynein regulatory complex protein 1-like isoform X1 n=1 Tax=Tachysurus vachellii TaxID=175792 RepID=UPI00296AF316|nr:dynein regulatory complex protein 1-like isoform X1 [Tachysurus vachellii]